MLFLHVPLHVFLPIEWIRKLAGEKICLVAMLFLHVPLHVFLPIEWISLEVTNPTQDHVCFHFLTLFLLLLTASGSLGLLFLFQLLFVLCTDVIVHLITDRRLSLWPISAVDFERTIGTLSFSDNVTVFFFSSSNQFPVFNSFFVLFRMVSPHVLIKSLLSAVVVVAPVTPLVLQPLGPGAMHVGKAGWLNHDDGHWHHFFILNTFQVSQLFSHLVGIAVVPEPTLIFTFTCIGLHFLG